MIGLGYRSEMRDWDLSKLPISFIEVAPENWIGKDTSRLEELGLPIKFHGVSLSLGGTGELNQQFLKDVRALMIRLNVTDYSDHIASSGDAHQLYDLFPIPFTQSEVDRLADRIKQAQDILGIRIGVENASYYTNRGELTENQFIEELLAKSDCNLLLDVNNLLVNSKNHKYEFELPNVDPARVSYLHVAGHDYIADLDLYQDTHGAHAEEIVAKTADAYSIAHNKEILLEWDNDIPTIDVIREELEWIKPSLTM